MLDFGKTHRHLPSRLLSFLSLPIRLPHKPVEVQNVSGLLKTNVRPVSVGSRASSDNSTSTSTVECRDPGEVYQVHTIAPAVPTLATRERHFALSMHLGRRVMYHSHDWDTPRREKEVGDNGYGEAGKLMNVARSRRWLMSSLLSSLRSSVNTNG